jgi:hypothetical protein
MLDEEKITFFHNELNEPFAFVPVQSHMEVWPCRSKAFKRYLSHRLWQSRGIAINSDALNSALNVIEGKACFEGVEFTLSNRLARKVDVLWYDLTNPIRQAVSVNSKEWKIVDNPPILFRRYNHQQAQVTPRHGGNPKTLLEFVNLKHEQSKLLFLVCVIACFIPDFPHPVLAIYGAQGSAKSMLCKLLKRLIDPSAIEVSSLPRDMAGLAQLLNHHWCIFFDNISDLPSGVSDTLCKAVTGDGFFKRELYSDDDDIIYNFKRCIGINGINLSVVKPDLLERSILLELDRIPGDRRKTEKEILEEFERNRSDILGGIFDTVVKAMEIKPSIRPDRPERMADFTFWGCAIAEALGYTEKEFLQAYHSNIESQNEQVLGENLIAIAVRALMERQSTWEGTPAELLKELTVIAREQNIDTDGEREWPKGANILSRRLNELKTNLDTDGIKFDKFERNKERMIRLQKHSKNIVSTVESAENSYSMALRGDDNGSDNRARSSQVSSPEIIPSSSPNDDRDGNDDTLLSIL